MMTRIVLSTGDELKYKRKQSTVARMTIGEVNPFFPFLDLPFLLRFIIPCCLARIRDGKEGGYISVALPARTYVTVLFLRSAELDFGCKRMLSVYIEMAQRAWVGSARGWKTACRSSLPTILRVCELEKRWHDKSCAGF